MKTRSPTVSGQGNGWPCFRVAETTVATRCPLCCSHTSQPGTGILTLDGSGFPALGDEGMAFDFSTRVTVAVGARDCDVVASSATRVECILVREQLDGTGLDSLVPRGVDGSENRKHT